jgi:hypothetical protein
LGVFLDPGSWPNHWGYPSWYIATYSLKLLI